MLDAEITTQGPVITDLRLPEEPFNGTQKVTEEVFKELNLMQYIARDVSKDNWPRWLASLLIDNSRKNVYPLILKARF